MKNLKENELEEQLEKNFHEKMNSSNIVQTYGGSIMSLEEIHVPFYERHAFLRIVIGILKEMTDLRLLVQNFGFLFITISNFFLFTGYFTPFLYITRLAIRNGIPDKQAAFLISIIGIVNIPFRMLFGFLADRRFITPINLNTMAVFVATVPLFFYQFMQYNFGTQVVFVVLFAIGIGK